MTLHWYRPNRFDQNLTVPEIQERLALVGIIERRFTAPLPCTYHYDHESSEVMARIGDVVVRCNSGKIEYWPRQDIGQSGIRVLMGSAELAFTRKPSRAEGWVFNRRKNGNYWKTEVLVSVQNDSTWGAFVTHMTNKANETELDLTTEQIETQQLHG